MGTLTLKVVRSKYDKSNVLSQVPGTQALKLYMKWISIPKSQFFVMAITQGGSKLMTKLGEQSI